MTDWLSGAGESLTYRHFWAISFVVCMLFVFICCLLGYMVLKWYRNRYWNRHYEHLSSWKENIPIYLLCILFLVSEVLLIAQSLANVIFVFGGSPFWTYIAMMVCMHIFFVSMMLLAGKNEWILSSLCLMVGVGAFGVIIPLSMFDYVAPSVTWLIGFAASTPSAILLVLRFMHHHEDIRDERSLRRRLDVTLRRKSIYIFVGVIYCIGVLVTYATAGTCLVVYGTRASGYWVHLSSTAQWSSRWMRTASIDACSPDGSEPCHVYLTAGSDLTSEVFVNVHLPLKMEGSRLWVISNDAQVEAEEYSVPMIDPHMQRRFFVAHLTGLKDGENTFSLRIGGISVGESVYSFVTVPKDITAARFAIAGDSGVTHTADQIMERMIASKPHVAFIGGDVAYDNGLLSCSCVWDDFLAMWESRRVEGKYLVPLSFAVGNHDVGVTDNFPAFDTLSREKCDSTSRVHARPMFFDWFTHEVDEKGKILPSCQRSTMRRHRVRDDMSIWILDTAYAESAQANVRYVESEITSKGSTKTNIAIYHVPMYAANTEDLDDGPYLRPLWPSQIFDKFKFKACFENHAHAYKRTKPLINNRKASEGGTVYLGDGRMGVVEALDRKSIIQPEDDNVFAHTDNEFHFLMVSMNGTDKLKVHAINEKGVVFDSQEL
jgi:hypothetical protein